MKCILLFSCLLLIVGCEAGDFNKLKPPLRNLTIKNTGVVTEKAAIYWPTDSCIGLPDRTYFPNDRGCEYFWMCANEILEEGQCTDGLYFDYRDSVCDLFESVKCWVPDYPDYPDYPEEPEIIIPENPEIITPEIPEEINPDSECPMNGSTDIVFLPSKNCNEYYICHNGVPNLFFCRQGSHWNAERRFCDLPANAGCTEIGGPDTLLPDCRMGFIGSVPHPWNCNWFVFCNNGNRSLQQCPHLQHFDVVSGRCLFLFKAKCISD